MSMGKIYTCFSQLFSLLCIHESTIIKIIMMLTKAYGLIIIKEKQIRKEACNSVGTGAGTFQVLAVATEPLSNFCGSGQNGFPRGKIFADGHIHVYVANRC